MTSIQEFQFESCVWESDAIVEAFLKAGFSRVELHPYKVDPDYDGSYSLPEYLTLVHGNFVVAIKHAWMNPLQGLQGYITKVSVIRSRFYSYTPGCLQGNKSRLLYMPICATNRLLPILILFTVVV